MVPLAFERISPEKQLAVINAGFSCFGETGFLKTSMRDVAQAAGISKASLFHYFGAKEALYRREMKGSQKFLLAFIPIITMYVSIIISMYDPEMMVLISGIFILVAYATVLEYVIAKIRYSGELELQELLAINGGLFALQLALGGICFLASCIFSDTKYSLGLGAGLPALMFVLQMLGNAGEKAEAAKYFTLFTLYDPSGILEGRESALLWIGILAVLALIFYLAGIIVFTKKDLHI